MAPTLRRITWRRSCLHRRIVYGEGRTAKSEEQGVKSGLQTTQDSTSALGRLAARPQQGQNCTRLCLGCGELCSGQRSTAV